MVRGTHGCYCLTTNHCVNTNIGKIIFGKGTQLYVQPSEYNKKSLFSYNLVSNFRNMGSVFYYYIFSTTQFQTKQLILSQMMSQTLMINLIINIIC